MHEQVTTRAGSYHELRHGGDNFYDHIGHGVPTGGRGGATMVGGSGRSVEAAVALITRGDEPGGLKKPLSGIPWK